MNKLLTAIALVVIIVAASLYSVGQAWDLSQRADERRTQASFDAGMQAMAKSANQDAQPTSGR